MNEFARRHLERIARRKEALRLAIIAGDNEAVNALLDELARLTSASVNWQ